MQNLFEREENLFKDQRFTLVFPQLPAHKRLGFNGCGRSGRRNRRDADTGSRQEGRRRADFGEALGYRSSEGRAVDIKVSRDNRARAGIDRSRERPRRRLLARQEHRRLRCATRVRHHDAG